MQAVKVLQKLSKIHSQHLNKADYVSNDWIVVVSKSLLSRVLHYL